MKNTSSPRVNYFFNEENWISHTQNRQNFHRLRRAEKKLFWILVGIIFLLAGIASPPTPPLAGMPAIIPTNLKVTWPLRSLCVFSMTHWIAFLDHCIAFLGAYRFFGDLCIASLSIYTAFPGHCIVFLGLCIAFRRSCIASPGLSIAFFDPCKGFIGVVKALLAFYMAILSLCTAFLGLCIDLLGLYLPFRSLCKAFIGFCKASLSLCVPFTAPKKVLRIWGSNLKIAS